MAIATDSSWPVVRSLQIVGITVAALKAGHGFGESFCFCPIINTTTDRSVALTQICKIYDTGLSMAAPSIITGTLSFSYVAYALYRNPVASLAQSAAWKFYAASAALMLSMVPATIFMVIPVVHRFQAEERKTEATRTLSEREVKQLISSWAVRNVIRQMLPVSASVLALYAGLCL